MSRPFWLRPLRLTEKSVVVTESVIRLAIRREPLNGLLRSSALFLLESTNADRVGVWGEETPGESVWQGYLAQSDSNGCSSEACKVNAFEAFPVEFTDSNAPLEFFAPVFPVGPREFFEGMSVVIGIPLKVDDRVLGALLIGAGRPGKLASRDAVENAAAEIAVSLFTNRLREQQERTQQSLHLREEIDNGILIGAGVQKVLGRITEAAAQRTGAQFVGVARRTDVGLQWEALSGPHLPAHSLQQFLLAVATAVFLDRDPVIQDFPSGSSAGLSIVGLPIDFSNEESLLLLAGYRSGDLISVDTLDGFRMLAANARLLTTARETLIAYRSLFESTREALVLADSQGRIVEANRRARELLHWKSDLGQGIALAEFFEEPSASDFEQWFGCGASAGRAPLLEARLENGLEVRIALRQALGGSQRLLLVLEEGLLAQRTESRWRQAQAELSSVLDAVKAGILLLGRNGSIRLTNPRFGMLFGLDAQIIAGLETFDDLSKLIQLRFRSPSAYRAPWESFLNGAGDPVHDKLEMASPTARVLERYARPILDDEGQCQGWLEAYWDVTAETQLHSKLQQAEKLAAVGQLISGIAHELNNPLTSIMGYAQLLRSHPETGGKGGDARLIFEEAERASRIVKNLLAYARRAEPERAATNVNVIVERTIALRSYELKIQNVDIRSDLDPHLPTTLADAHQLQQAILNLLINAEQAILDNRKQGRIQVRTKVLSGSRFSIEVSDDGPGIPREISARVFDPYFTTKPTGVGTGLGLAIVRRIAEQHEGKVSFENIPGGGTRFRLELPLLPVPPSQSPPAEVMGPNAPKPASAHVLVVEDEPTVARLVADVLREDGHDVEAVIDSQEGLERVFRRRFDLIICDLRMPRLDGPAFYDALVRARSTARHRMLFITGDTLGPHTIEFLKSHELQFLTKPFLVEELKLAVYRVLERVTSAGVAGAEAHG